MPTNEPALRFGDRFSHLIESGQSFVLVGDEDSVVLEGDIVPALMRHIDGSRTAVDLANALADVYSPAVVHFAILRLIGDGAIAEVSDEVRGPAALPVPGSLAERLQTAWVARGDKYWASVDVSDDHTVVLADDYLHGDLARVVADLRDGGKTRVTMVRPGAPMLWVGPSFSALSDACVACLQERLRLNLTARAFLHSEMRQSESQGLAGSAEVQIARLPNLIPGSVFEHVEQSLGRTGTTQSITAVSLDDGSRVVHRVKRLPHCARCGDPTLSPLGPDFVLQSRAVVEGSSGGTRVCSPQDTLDRYSDLISPLTGIVRHIRRVEVDPEGLVQVFTASHAGSYDASSVKAVKDDARDHSGGKGVTELDAQVSALCESLERFSAAHRGTETVRRASLSGLGPDAIAPNELLQFSEAQYRSRHEWNAGCSGSFQRVPEPYANDVIDWSPFRSLTIGTVRWLPSAHLYLGFQGAGGEYCRGDSNGLAGGNCVEEAILQGFLELVERDAIALWWYNRTQMPAVDLHSRDDSFIEAVVAYHSSIDRKLWALDLTTDLGIPCIATLSAKVCEGPEDIVFGFGCHPEPAVALRRSVTEVNQMLPAVLRSQQERERQLLPVFADAIEWWNTATRATHPYLEPGYGPAGARWEAFGSPDDINSIIDECVLRAGRAGLEVLAHDLTREDVGLSVAKVVAPGLRHFWRRTGPGRLYHAAMALGRLERPLAEHELNPVSMFV